MSQTNHSFNSFDNISAAMFADCIANSKEIFKLMDLIFPLDSCQHYQLLPLKLEDNNLTLGMLNPNDQESLKFVHSIAKVFNYNLNIQSIDAQTHQIILASYPQSNQQPQKLAQDANQTIIDASFNPEAISQDNSRPRRLADSAPTIISQPEDQPYSAKSGVSEVLKDLPPDLDFLRDLDLTAQPSKKSVNSKTDSSATLYEIPAEFLKPQPSNNLDDKPTIISDDPAKLLAQETSPQDPQNTSSEVPRSNLAPKTPINPQEVLQLQTEAVVDFLVELKPLLSWRKLLEQALIHRIEQLNLIQYSDRGSIIASKNQETQSSLDHIALPIFCSLIDDIKRMARLPHDSNEHPKKLVLEKLYKQERILLRLHFIFQNERQELIVQILRDRALKIYEQQQMNKVSEQALNLAQQLEKTLRKIQACFDSAEFTNLRELQEVQSRINHQLRLFDKQPGRIN